MRARFILFLLIAVFSLGIQTIYAAGIGLDPILRPESAPTVTGEVPDENSFPDVEYGVASVRGQLLIRFIKLLLSIAGVVAIYSIVNNGWWLAASGGSEESVSQHKKGLTWAVLGLVLIILSYSIIRFIIEIPFSADEQEPASSTSQPSEASSGSSSQFQLTEPTLTAP